MLQAASPAPSRRDCRCSARRAHTCTCMPVRVKEGGQSNFQRMSPPFSRFLIIWIILISPGLGNCTPSIPTPQTSSTTSITETPELPIASSSETMEPSSELQAINPLTGLPVADPSLLQLPALLISISHFPVNARPQAGLSFAPYVFEIYITEGATRFLTTFYGEFPAPEVPIVGNCDVRREPFTQTDLILGNQVWLDSNQNNIHDAWERGVGGVCVNLYDKTGALLQQTTTDSNGYYGFNVGPGKYFVAFLEPPEMQFDQKDVGAEENDSDVDPGTGRTDAVDITSSFLHVDVGLIPLTLPPPGSAPQRRRAGQSMMPAEMNGLNAAADELCSTPDVPNFAAALA